jgi:hypothetical protein
MMKLATSIPARPNPCTRFDGDASAFHRDLGQGFRGLQEEGQRELLQRFRGHVVVSGPLSQCGFARGPQFRHRYKFVAHTRPIAMARSGRGLALSQHRTSAGAIQNGPRLFLFARCDLDRHTPGLNHTAARGATDIFTRGTAPVGKRDSASCGGESPVVQLHYPQPTLMGGKAAV